MKTPICCECSIETPKTVRNELRTRIDKHFELLEFMLRKYHCTCGPGMIARRCPVHDSQNEQNIIRKRKELFDDETV